MRIFAKILLKIIFPLAVVAFLLLMMDREAPRQKTIREIMLVMFNDSPLSDLSREGIERGLSEPGWKDEKDYQLKISNAQGDGMT